MWRSKRTEVYIYAQECYLFWFCLNMYTHFHTKPRVINFQYTLVENEKKKIIILRS
jgi:hypothetical protein